MFSANDETTIEEELRVSFQKWGPIHKVKRTKFGIACGATRLRAVPEWPVEDVDVKDYYAHLQLTAADNLHAMKGPAWWSFILGEAAEYLLRQGVERGKLAVHLKDDFPLHPRTIYKYLPDAYKGSQGPKGPRGDQEIAHGSISVGDKLGVSQSSEQAFSDKSGVGLDSGRAEKPAESPGSLVTRVEDRVGDGASASHAEASAMCTTPHHLPPQSPNLRDVTSFPSPRMGEGQVSEYTDAHVRLLEKLAGLSYVSEQEFIRPGEFTSEGTPKTWRVDCAFDYLVVEVEGAGSASSNNMMRDEFFEGKGIHVLHLPNRCAECSKDEGFIRQAVEKLDRLSSKVVAMEVAEHDLLEQYRGSDAEKWRKQCLEKDGAIEGLRRSIAVLETQVNLAKTPSLPKQPSPDAAVHEFKGTFNCKCGRVTPFTINSPVPLQHSDVKVDSTLEPTRRGGV